MIILRQKEFATASRKAVYSVMKGIRNASAKTSGAKSKVVSKVFRPDSKIVTKAAEKAAEAQKNLKSTSILEKTIGLENGARNFYENTGDVINSGVSRFTGAAFAKPGTLVKSATITALPVVKTSAAIAVAPASPVISTVLAATPISPFTTVAGAKSLAELKVPYKQLAPAKQKRYKLGYKLGKVITKPIKGKSLKGAVETVKSPFIKFRKAQ